MALRSRKITFQKSKKVSQKRCGQALKSLKRLWIHSCSQGGYRKKEFKCDFVISAHPLSFEFKGIYGVWRCKGNEVCK